MCLLQTIKSVTLLFLSLEIALIYARLLTELLLTAGKHLSRFIVIRRSLFLKLRLPWEVPRPENAYIAEHSILRYPGCDVMLAVLTLPSTAADFQT